VFCDICNFKLQNTERLSQSRERLHGNTQQPENLIYSNL